MKILERLPVLTIQELKQVEANARAKIGTSENAMALHVIAAVVEERARRKTVESNSLQEKQAEISARLKNCRLYDRVFAAFTEHPARGWERDMIVALAAQPGSTTEELSSALGYSGSYMNWFGIVCQDREAWLGPARTTELSREKVYASAVIVDFGQRVNAATGKTLSTWSFKPEAHRAFLTLGIASS